MTTEGGVEHQAEKNRVPSRSAGTLTDRERPGRPRVVGGRDDPTTDKRAVIGGPDVMLLAVTSRPAVHGTRACYVGGCRCADCCDANTDYIRAWRAGHPGYAYNLRLAARPSEARVRRRRPNGARLTP